MCVLVLLWTAIGAGVALGGPVQHGSRPRGSGQEDLVLRGSWPKGSGGVDPGPSGTEGDPVDESFYQLPVYRHAPGPLVPRDVFRPVPQKRPLPAGLDSLLLPSNRQQNLPDPDGRAVQVRCGLDHVAVRVDRFRLRAWTDPARFRLGSCQAHRTGPRYLVFYSRLTDCGGDAKVAGGQLVYTFSLCYTPPPQGYVIRVPLLDLPIHCYYDRFHYSYQVGFRPQVQQTTFMKSMRSKINFSLSVCNAQWEPLAPDHWLVLGEPVYFVAEAGPLLAGEQLYVDSCYASSSEDGTGLPRVDIITNYGCMTDSQREASRSCFQSRENQVIRFLVDAFILRAASQVLFLHCSMSISLSTSYTSKICNYNKAAGRWEDLEASSPVCSCCDSACGDLQEPSKNMVTSPGLNVRKAQDKLKMRARSFQAEEGRETLDPEEKNEPSVDEQQEKLKSFPQETEILQEEEAVPEETVVNQQGNGDVGGETEEVVVGSTEAPEDLIGPEQYELVQDGEQVSGSIRAMDSSIFNSSDTRDDGSAENVSVGDGTQREAERVDPDPAGGAEIIESGRPGSVEVLMVQGQIVDGLETSAGPHPVSRNQDSGSAGESDVEMDPLDPLMWSEPVESADKPVDKKPERMTRHVGDSVGSEGPDGGTPPGLRVRGSGSGPLPGVRDPVCVDGSDCDSGLVERKVLRQSQFTEAENAKRRKFSDTRPERVRSGSARPLRAGPGHSAVVTVMTSRHNSDRTWTDGEWAEVLRGWS